MTTRMIVVGGGGHAKVVIDTAMAAGWTIEGLVDSDERLVGSTVLGHHVVGTDAFLANLDPALTALGMGVGTQSARIRLFDALKGHGFTFPSLVHPSAILASSVVVEEGAQVMAGAVVQPAVTIARNAVINTAASVDHDCIIAEHAFISPGATLAGGVSIGMGALVGAGAVILPGLFIGARATVAAGAVVTRDVDDDATVVGIPARSSKHG